MLSWLDETWFPSANNRPTLPDTTDAVFLRGSTMGGPGARRRWAEADHPVQDTTGPNGLLPMSGCTRRIGGHAMPRVFCMSSWEGVRGAFLLFP